MPGGGRLTIETADVTLDDDEIARSRTERAALEGKLITPDTVQYDPGSLQVGGVTFKNAGGVAHGVISLRTAEEMAGRRRFRGEVLAAGDEAVTLGVAGSQPIHIPYEAIVRGNLIDEG